MHAWLNIAYVHQNISVTVSDGKKVSIDHLQGGPKKKPGYFCN